MGPRCSSFTALTFYFWRLHLGCKIHKSCVHVWKWSWCAKRASIINFCWSEILFFVIIPWNNPMPMKVFLEGTGAMTTPLPCSSDEHFRSSRKVSGSHLVMIHIMKSVKLWNIRPSNDSFTVNYEWIKNKHQGNPNVVEMPEGSLNCIRLINVPKHQILHFSEVQIDLHPLLWDMDPASVRYLHSRIIEQQPQ